MREDGHQKSKVSWPNSNDIKDWTVREVPHHTIQRLIDQKKNLVHDAVLNWKQEQVLKGWCDMTLAAEFQTYCDGFLGPEQVNHGDEKCSS